MAKAASHITPLSADLLPAVSSTQLIVQHVERMRSKLPQKVIALSLGFGPNYVSMLKAGEPLPMPRVIAFSAAAGLSDAERNELLDTRLRELHGEKGEICVESLASWAQHMFERPADENLLAAMWQEAVEPWPMLPESVLANPARADRIRAALAEVVQAELRAMADDAAVP